MMPLRPGPLIIARRLDRGSEVNPVGFLDRVLHEKPARGRLAGKGGPRAGFSVVLHASL